MEKKKRRKIWIMAKLILVLSRVSMNNLSSLHFFLTLEVFYIK